MTLEIQKKAHSNRLAKLSIERKKIMSMQAEKALDTILDSPDALPLVHSFPEEDFYFLINDIGIEDSLPLLSLASNKQWEFILDLEICDKDRINNKTVTKWIDLLMQADPRRLVEWLIDEKTELLKLYLYKNIEIRVREHDQDPSDFGRDFLSLDDIFYFRFIDYPFKLESEQQPNEDDKELRKALLLRLLNFMADNDHVKYQSLLLKTSGVLAAESEEEFYRLRNVRLAEKGFLPFDEAIGIYQPVNLPEVKSYRTKEGIKSAGKNSSLPIPLYPSVIIEESNIFTRSLNVLETDGALQHIQLEFAGLCNQIVVADQKIIREKETLASTVKKACGYISIGLQHLSEDDTLDKSAAIIKKVPLAHIFRIGFGEALKLKWHAQKWHKDSWSAKEGLSLTFWGENWMGVLGGLLLKKPLFFDNYETGVLYREFATLSDINKTDQILNDIIAVDKLLSLMTITINTDLDAFLTYKKLILTLWARDCLGISKTVSPIGLDEFKQFFSKLLTIPKISPKGNSGPDSGRIGTSMRTSFLNFLSSETGLADVEIIQELGKPLENLLTEIGNEYGDVSKKDIDPRFIDLFLVRTPGE